MRKAKKIKGNHEPVESISENEVAKVKTLTLELLRDRHTNGKQLKKGDTIELPEVEAEKLLAKTDGIFKLV